MTNSRDESIDSLLGALTKARIPAENHDFIRAMVSKVGIAEYRAMSIDSTTPFVLATRRDGLPPLRIYYGYTSGFLTESEAASASGTPGHRPSSGKGPWFVAHPINKVRYGGERPKDRRREAGLCATCGIQLPLTGVCDDCD